MADGGAIIAALAQIGRAPLPADVAAAVRQAATAVLEGQADSLDQELGLRPAPGHRRPSTIMGLAARDRLLRQAADRFFPDRLGAEQARDLATALARYHAAAWHRERGLAEPPAHRRGKLEDWLWRILQARDRVLSPRQIRFILAASSGCSPPDY